MSSLNKVQLIGNLGNDPDTKYTASGVCITTISIATTEKWKDRDGNQQEKTAWHRVKMWNKLGEIAGEYLRKGASVYIEGKLEYGSYEKDGVTHYTTDIVASEMKMLGGKREGDNDNRQRQDSPPQRQQQAPQRQAPPMDDFADDDQIPF